MLMAALHVLPMLLSVVAGFYVYELPYTPDVAVVFGQLAVTTLQILAAWLIIRGRYSRIACGVYALALVGLVILAIVWMDDHEAMVRPFVEQNTGLRGQVALAINMLGPPLFVFVVPRLFGVRTLTSSRARAAGGVLIALAFTAYLDAALQLVDSLRTMTSVDASDVLGLGIWPLMWLAIATCGLIAGLRLVSGRPARKAMLTYVIVAIGLRLVLDAIAVIYLLTTTEGAMRFKFVIAYRAAVLVGAVVSPLVLWRYAKPELEEGVSVRGDGALVWAALWLAPLFIARCLLLPDLDVVFGERSIIAAIVCCAALAILYTVAAIRTLRDESSRGLWIVAALVAAALLALAIYTTLDIDERRMVYQVQALWFVPLLVAIPATIAWLRGRPEAQRNTLDEVFD